ncbi:uncharacterized protein Z519_12263 [Cladophialophora bantiana CBS 173.52]|uniref:BD-FAE-like domain-containing protein n=1 Tax=Cladophialophora bantiana (strain ATCC 10958 / CBS 173.52 / CDC B-1940 / NIH 8579) TaxID=1442370 RepID=A0A0D2FKD4_CLAB1|nr:uncharacterized protein Z519_12263 [Cladophialophora bantiana CBS 173.52]KIW87152.1 hypothetical protein Z519_12263 [Cladophialophora bantiana CBS 173.52]
MPLGYCRRGLGIFLRPKQGRIFKCQQKKLCASASTSEPWKHHSIELTVGVSGRVKLDVFAPDGRAAAGHGPRNLLVHLPSGPSIDTNDTPSIEVLPQFQHSLPPSTSLVSINYRLGYGIDSAVLAKESTCFPVPIHDVSTAFDYLTSPTSPYNADYEEAPKICLLGSNIGGALATMLALTEPNAIHALAVVEPMVDWAGLDDIVERLRTVETSSPIPQKRQKQKATTRRGVKNQSVLAAAEELIKLRAKLFKTPSAYFDPFASPMLFLRAPGKDTPSTTSVTDQSVHEAGLGLLNGYGDDDLPQSGSLTLTGPSAASHGATEIWSDEKDTGPNLMPKTQPRRRKVLRRWPAVGLPESVTLPHVKIFVPSQTGQDAHPGSSEVEDLARGHAALIRAQGLEMAELMRRACFLGREKSFAEEHVQVHERQTIDELEQQPEHQSQKAAVQRQGGKAQTKVKMQGAIEWVAGMFARE